MKEEYLQQLEQMIKTKENKVSRTSQSIFLLKIIASLILVDQIPNTSLKDVSLACVLSIMITKLSFIIQDKKLLQELKELQNHIQNDIYEEEPEHHVKEKIWNH